MDAGELGLQFKWSDELTRRFIQLRNERRFCFTGKRNSARAAWEGIMVELGIDGLVSADQCRKKWSNLCQHYKDIKREMSLRSETSGSGNSNWIFYDMMDEILGSLFANNKQASSKFDDDEETAEESKIVTRARKHIQRLSTSQSSRKIKHSDEEAIDPLDVDDNSSSSPPAFFAPSMKKARTNVNPNNAGTAHHPSSPSASHQATSKSTVMQSNVGDSVEDALLKQITEGNKLIMQLQNSFVRHNEVLLGAIERLTRALLPNDS